ncbi:carboxylesterase family protein [Peribacillus sp. YIM B13481]
MIKQLFEADSFASPKNMEIIKEQVHVEKDLTYDKHGMDNSILDIYYPKNMNKPLPVIMWIHGGAFVSGSKEQTKKYGMALANEGYFRATNRTTKSTAKSTTKSINGTNPAIC